MALSFSLGSLLDGGAYGNIYQANYVSPYLIKNNIVVKVIPRQSKYEDMIMRETKHWKVLSGHPNILCLEGIEYDRYNVYMLSEYCDKGSLHDILKQEKSYELTLKDIHTSLHNIIKGVNHCHNHNIVHGDVKPANVILANNGVFKLCDFGNSRYNIQNDEGISNISSGTILFLPPEFFSSTPNYGNNIDVWAFGISMYMLYYKGQYPFNVNIKKKLISFEDVIGFPPNNKLSKVAKELIQQCLNVNKKNRLNSFEVLKHPYFKSCI